MSAGAFTTARYEVTPAIGAPVAAARVTNCRVQPETLSMTIATVANAASVDALTPGLTRAVVSASARRRGIIRCRGVRIRFTAALPAGYKSGTIIFLPWMRFGTWSAFVNNDSGVYLTVPIELVGTRSGTVS
jgi:hypothetical protein